MTKQEYDELVGKMMSAFQQAKLLDYKTHRECMSAALAVAEPHIRADEREACARVSEGIYWPSDGTLGHSTKQVADAIRARA